MPRVLVVDDHDTLREGMALTLTRAGHTVLAARSGKEALAAYRKAPFDLVVTDLKMDGMDGIALTRELKALEPSAVVLLVTAFGSIETAVEAMQQGASDFITKPFPPEVLRAKVDKGLELAATRKQVERLSARTEVFEKEAHAERGALVGTSEPMERLATLMRKAAATDVTVLIRGESGTGKELVARQLHALSLRKDGPFISVHCAALAETLLESELFGHERGSFTGAIKRKLGRFELAEGGTLFLDEVGEIPLSVQTKLLRVLQEREIQRVGSEETLPVNVRVLSATHRDLQAEVKAGRFREDLYYRLHIVPLELPPLRERPEDLAVLAEHFIAKHGPAVNRKVKGLSPEAQAALSRHAWPGNVRELENVIEQALVFADQELLQLDDLPLPLKGRNPLPSSSLTLPVPRGDQPLPEILEELERQLIAQAYEKAGQVKTETARLLGIKTSALYYKLEKYGFLPKGTSVKSEPD